MARKQRHTNPTPRRAIDDTFVAPRKGRARKADVTLAEAIAEQAAEEGRSEEEVREELHAEPTPDEAPTKPGREAGTSNLARTIREHRHRYVPALHPTSGKKTANNGDVVARLLLRVPLEELAKFVYRWCGKEYSRLNPGHNRMCCGNLIRAGWKKGDPAVLEQLAIWTPSEQPEAEEAASEE